MAGLKSRWLSETWERRGDGAFWSLTLPNSRRGTGEITVSNSAVSWGAKNMLFLEAALNVHEHSFPLRGL